ncbi:hypothetical protein Trydic_g23949 [Trypoxylus dichotomus]
MGFESDYFAPSSGVPQGSNLGPLLFLIYIYDLCPKLLYADDLKLYSTINNSQDCNHLQSQLDIFHTWCVNNKLTVNVSKCKIVTYIRKTTPIIYTYHLAGSSLPRETSMRDLGVVFDSRLTFMEHISSICTSALSMLGFIIRVTRPFASITAILPLYFAFVRSRLEYASLVWSPMYIYQIHLLEQIQRRCLKFLYFKKFNTYPIQGFSHSALLEAFNIDSLELRRKQAECKFLFTLLHNGLDVAELLSKINFIVPRSGSRQTNTFYCFAPRTNIAIRSPIHRLCSNFNSMEFAELDIHTCTLPSLLTLCRPRVRYT